MVSTHARKPRSCKLTVEQLELRKVLAGLVASGEGPQDVPAIIDALSMRSAFTTNISSWVMAGKVGPGDIVKLNGDVIPAAAIDEQGNFSLVVPLQPGINRLAITVESSLGTLLKTTTKNITYDPTFSTANARIAYVDAVHGETPDSPLSGTVVINQDLQVVLGILQDVHIRGISDDGREIYMANRSVWDTGTHSPLRTLPFSQDIPSSGVIVSGDRIYSRTEVVTISSNVLEATTLPIDITTGSSWANALPPGGPTISPNGQTIYAGNQTIEINTANMTMSPTGMAVSGQFVSDMQVTPDGQKLLISNYASNRGSLNIFDTQTRTLLRSLPTGDFAGEVRVSADGAIAVVGIAGNPMLGGGGVLAYNILTGSLTGSWSSPLADNFTLTKLNEVLVSSGASDATTSRLGINVLTLTENGQLVLSETYYLGNNLYVRNSGRPVNDQIATVFHKAAPLLRISVASTSMSEFGGSILATVHRLGTDLTQPLTFTPASSELSEAIVPSSVTIPAGQTSVTFAITAADDAVLDGDQSVRVSVVAAGFAHNDVALTVTDHEALTIVLDKSSISERGGAAIGTVTRSNISNRHQTLSIRSSDRSEANVTAVVVIPANQSSTTFAITGVDDTLLDGSRPVTFTASAPGYVSGSANLVVTDYETLTLTISPPSVSERGGVATGTVTRSNTNISSSRTVRLTSSDTSEARVPSTVTIPANQASVTFSILAVDDLSVDGAQRVVITASSVGYVSGSADLLVTDNEPAGANLQSASIAALELGAPSDRWQNAIINQDVDGDNVVTARDALLVINSLNELSAGSAGRLPTIRPMDSLLVDVDGDSYLTALDALIVINFLNLKVANTSIAATAEGESDNSATDAALAAFDYREFVSDLPARQKSICKFETRQLMSRPKILL